MVQIKEKIKTIFSIEPLCIFFLAFTLRIIAVSILTIEKWEYETIANNILSGNGFTFPHFGNAIYRSYCEPLYPFITAAVYFLTHHNVFILAIVQAVFSSIIPVIIYFISKKIFQENIAIISGVLAAIHPGLIVYTTKLHPLIFDSLLISATLLSSIVFFNKLNLRNAITLGILSGICSLTRPTILAFLSIGLIYIFIVKKQKISRAVFYSAIILIFSAIIFMPWAARNYKVQGKFMLTRSNGPYVFWLGNNPHFSGSSIDKNGVPIYKLAPKYFLEKLYKMDENGQNAEFLKNSFEYIKSYPFGFFERTLKKFYYFWWFAPPAGVFYPAGWFILYKLFYAFILILGLYGILGIYKENMFREKKEIILIFILLFSIAFIQSLFYIETRHRWAVEPVFLILTAKGISQIVRCLRKNKCS